MLYRGSKPEHAGPRPPARGLTRRHLLGGGAAFLSVATAASCDLLGTEPAAEQEDPDDTAGANGREAPALARQVEAGDLPPVEERLPENPLVIEPFERVGRYGGDWNSATAGPGDTVWLFRTIGYEQLMSWDVEFTEPILNVAEAVEVEDDGRTYTFRLREGMKWSDGEPFTADDIVFAWEDVLLDEELIGVAPRQLTVGDQPPELEKVDDYTVRFVFAEPHGLFLQYLATPAGRHSTILPRHYLEQFHKKYNADVDELAEEQGFDDWAQLFLDRGGGWASRWENPELPTLQAWRITTPIGEGTRVVAERNPYYWKTDPEGGQLPYLDRITYDVISDTEVILLRATNGELDMVSWHINSPTNKPVLARDRENGGYRFFDMTWSWPNRMVIMLNLTCQDPELREVLQNKDLRIGLSHAINREELIAAVLQQQGEPWQAAPLPDSPFYDEELATQYTAYDVDQANERLDRAGYTGRDGDGFRLGPNGQRISFAVDVPTPVALFPFWPDAMELVQGYWQDVGIDAQVSVISRDRYAQRANANEHEATIGWGDGGLLDAILDPRFYFPSRAGDSKYAVAWANWYTGGDPQEEPPEAAQRQMELYERLKTVLDEGQRNDLFRQILQIAKEEFYCIGIALPQGDYGIVKNNFHNVPDPMVLSWMYPTPGPTRPEQYFVAAE